MAVALVALNVDKEWYTILLSAKTASAARNSELSSKLETHPKQNPIINTSKTPNSTTTQYINPTTSGYLL